jgi:hypothetical protein
MVTTRYSQAGLPGAGHWWHLWGPMSPRPGRGHLVDDVLGFGLQPHSNQWQS